MKKFLLLLILLLLLAAGGWYFLQVNTKAQKQTVTDLRNTGTAWMSWLTDESSNPESIPDLIKSQETRVTIGFAKHHVPTSGTEYKKLTYAETVKILRPSDTFFYMQDIPKTDGWGHELEYYVNENILDAAVLLIRSPGKDGVFSGNFYQVQPTPAEEYDNDIVWADGYFVTWPAQPTP